LIIFLYVGDYVDQMKELEERLSNQEGSNEELESANEKLEDQVRWFVGYNNNFVHCRSNLIISFTNREHLQEFK